MIIILSTQRGRDIVSAFFPLPAPIIPLESVSCASDAEGNYKLKFSWSSAPLVDYYEIGVRGVAVNGYNQQVQISAFQDGQLKVPGNQTSYDQTVQTVQKNDDYQVYKVAIRAVWIGNIKGPVKSEWITTCQPI